MTIVSKMRKDLELITDRLGIRDLGNGATIYAEDGLRIIRSCDDIDFCLDGEMVASQPRVASAKPPCFRVGDHDWIRRIAELAKVMDSGTDTQV
jgi:hypothetical protein